MTDTDYELQSTTVIMSFLPKERNREINDLDTSPLLRWSYFTQKYTDRHRKCFMCCGARGQRATVSAR